MAAAESVVPQDSGTVLVKDTERQLRTPKY